MTAPQVMTVTGPVDGSTLGVVLPHEHLLIDLSPLWHPPDFPWQEPLREARPALANRGDLTLDPYVSRPNMVLDDIDVAVEEALAFKREGGGTIVDLTTEGIGPRPAGLREIARRTGLHIVAGCGTYVRRAHPSWVAAATEEEIADRLERQIREGFEGTEVRPGIIGEIGTGNPIDDQEARVLRAAAAVQRRTGLAINVHVAIFGRRAVDALRVLDRAGADLSRVVISHMDELIDGAYHRAVLGMGATVEFDTFGSEVTFLGSGTREPGDGQRIEALLQLLHEGWEERLLLSQDVCTAMQLRRNGGYGYAHILRAIVPQLQRRGVDELTLRTMLVRNPACMLTPAF